jgi:lysophospholipase L1-like esterase
MISSGSPNVRARRPTRLRNAVSRWPVLGLLAGTLATFITLYLRWRWGWLDRTAGEVFLVLIGLSLCLAGEIAVGCLAATAAATRTLRLLVFALALATTAVIRASWGLSDRLLDLLVGSAIALFAVPAAEAAMPRLPARARHSINRRASQWLLGGTAATAATLCLGWRWYLLPRTGEVFLPLVGLSLCLGGEIGIGCLDVSRGTRIRLRVLLIGLALTATAAIQARWGESDGLFALLVGAAFASFVVCAAETAVARRPREGIAQIRLLVSVTVLLLAGIEGALRWMAYSERHGIGYVNRFYKPEWHWVYMPGTAIAYARPEFTYARQVNAMGLTDKEFTADKAPGEYRIVALGDSFTEGVGADAASTWVKAAERQLAAHDPSRRVAVMNAGVAGSDPFFEYMLLKEKLRPLRPDLVVVVLNETDVSDIVIRGGVERFRPDRTLVYHYDPRWKRLYAGSYLVRLVVHGGFRYNSLLMSESRLAREEPAAGRQIVSAVRLFRELGAADGFRLLVVAQPLSGLITSAHYSEPFGSVVRELGQEPGIDFLDLLTSYARDGVTGAGAREYFWPIDSHHNPRGYELMGRAIARHIWEAGLVAPPAAGRP